MTSASPERHFDPITFQVLWSRTVTIADEIAATLVKTAFSHVVRDNHDYACAIYDAEGRMLAQANQCTPGQLGCMPRFVKDVLQAYPAETLRPGDVLITNDPWLGSGHTPDIYIATPVFKGRKLVGFAANSAHHIDIGGRMSSPESREVYEEGLILPLCKLYNAGQPNDDIFRIVRRNVRMEDKVIGDLRAQLAANHMGAARMLALLEEAGLGSFESLAADIIAHSEAAMRQAIAEVPRGVYTHEMDHEDTDREGRPLKVKVRVEVRGDEIHVDYTGSSPQVSIPINSVYNITYAYTVFPIKSALHPHLPNNEGCARPVRVTAPEGSIFNATFPAPVMWRTSLVYHAVEAIFGALAQAIPERVMAPSGTYPLWLGIFAGKYDDGRDYMVHFNAQGGQGGMHHRDGIGTTIFPGNVANTPVEFLETETPLVCERKALVADSGGPGRYRGGVGQEVVIRNRSSQPAVCSMIGGRLHEGPVGLNGGAAGGTGMIRIGDDPPLERSRQLVLEPRQTLHLRYPGGGGFGDPFERDPALVAADVRRGLVSPEQARSAYGVDVGPDGRGWDEGETMRLRSRRG
ncbi:MAG: hydantoinase B/oxoprolinase family protein [Candidatus Lambdaproteobacteria bacterium]|nr:hydantoinase B/oxoprolinase family protein [Candidatus Lambdaproteobacteria bacterium]